MRLRERYQNQRTSTFWSWHRQSILNSSATEMGFQHSNRDSLTTMLFIPFQAPVSSFALQADINILDPPLILTTISPPTP